MDKGIVLRGEQLRMRLAWDDLRHEDMETTCFTCLAHTWSLKHHLLSSEDRLSTEIETRGQATNLKWFEHHRGSITYTQFPDI